MEVKRTSFNMPTKIHERLKLISVAKKVTQSELIEEYLKYGIEKDINLVKNLLD
jgi:predicted DNA-binding protein